MVAAPERTIVMASGPDPAEILSRFPGPLTLYPSRRKWLLLLAGCALFTAGGFAMIQDQAAGGWYVLVVFGIASLIAAVMLLPGAGRLTLDRHGFTSTSLFKSHRVRWQDAGDFVPVRVPPANIRLVGYDDATAAGRRIAAINVELTGRNAALHDTYGLPVDDLAGLMAAWRERALERRPSA
jgi:hypothetical protein